MSPRLAAIVVAAAALAGCNAIWGIPDRELDPHVACADGACACAAGFGDCNGDDADGCESDFSRDPSHCGACARTCLGGTCASGLCQPVALATAPAFIDVALAGSTLYVATCGTPPVLALPAAGGPLAPAIGGIGGCAALVRPGSSTVYWSSPATPDAMLHASSLDPASMPMTLAGSIHPGNSLVIGGAYLYWDEHVPAAPPARLMRIPTSGGAAEELAGGGVRAVVADGVRVYWSDDTSLRSRPHGGTEVTLLAAGVSADLLAIDDAHLYYADAGAIARVPLVGGLPATIVEAVAPGAIAVDGEHVYWFDGERSALARAPREGGPATVITSLPASTALRGLTADDRALYWLAGGTIYRVAK